MPSFQGFRWGTAEKDTRDEDIGIDNDPHFL